MYNKFNMLFFIINHMNIALLVFMSISYLSLIHI